jgi:glycerol-3-phosphate dehydrogenase
MDREQIVTNLNTNPNVDVLVIGAGINGVGVFRDLALQGVNVLLIDRKDFCAGASAASSHMAHGGIRYLENGEFRLVREAVHERNRLILNAPHLVKPLPTVIPIFKFFSGLLNAPLKFLNLLDRPSERGAFVIKVGLILYDAFTRGQGTVPAHHFFGKKESFRRWPQLNPAVRWTATYYDGSIQSPERLTVELVLDAEATGPHAQALNYASALLSGSDTSTLVIRDELTGKQYPIHPKFIVNAAGPWIDQVNSELNITKRYIGGTKGSHIIIDHPELHKAIGENEFFFENKDGRIVLLFPFFDRVLIGTSDLPIENADDARCTDEEVHYFIELVNRVFPSIVVKEENIVFRFSGVRPLAYSKAKTTGQISRDHSTLEDELSLPTGKIHMLSLVGGKWTTYRAFAEQVTDKILSLMKYPRKYSTADLGIGGGAQYPITDDQRKSLLETIQKTCEMSSVHAADLFVRYGTRAKEVAAFLAAEPDSPLENLKGWTRREIGFLIEKEKALFIEDILLRRSTIAWLGNTTLPLINELADIFAESFGWDTQKRDEAIKRCLDILEDENNVKL